MLKNELRRPLLESYVDDIPSICVHVYYNYLSISQNFPFIQQPDDNFIENACAVEPKPLGVMLKFVSFFR